MTFRHGARNSSPKERPSAGPNAVGPYLFNRSFSIPAFDMGGGTMDRSGLWRPTLDQGWKEDQVTKVPYMLQRKDDA